MRTFVACVAAIAALLDAQPPTLAQGPLAPQADQPGGALTFTTEPGQRITVTPIAGGVVYPYVLKIEPAPHRRAGPPWNRR